MVNEKAAAVIGLKNKLCKCILNKELRILKKQPNKAIFCCIASSFSSTSTLRGRFNKVKRNGEKSLLKFCEPSLPDIAQYNAKTAVPT